VATPDSFSDYLAVVFPARNLGVQCLSGFNFPPIDCRSFIRTPKPADFRNNSHEHSRSRGLPDITVTFVLLSSRAEPILLSKPQIYCAGRRVISYSLDDRCHLKQVRSRDQFEVHGLFRSVHLFSGHGVHIYYRRGFLQGARHEHFDIAFELFDTANRQILGCPDFLLIYSS
jgi:hypothetical protein